MVTLVHGSGVILDNAAKTASRYLRGVPVEHLRTYYCTYAPMVYRRCLSLLGNEPDALDAMQLVFVQILEKRPEMNNPPAFLYRAGTNTCLNLIRSDRRYQQRLGNLKLLKIATYEEPGLLTARSTLARLFGQASESTQFIAVMHFVDGLTLEQVADSVGLSVSGVRKRLRKLRTQLQTLETEAS